MSILLKKSALVFFSCSAIFISFSGIRIAEYRSGIIKGEDKVLSFPQFPGGEEVMKKYLVIDVLMPEGNTPEWLG